MADRTGQAYDEPIIPDILIDTDAAGEGDDTLDAALEWFHETYSACGADG